MMYSLFSSVLSVLATVPCSFAASSAVSEATAINANSVVDLGYAKYQGVKDPVLGTINFYGLKYAAAPVGNLRWRPPVNIEDSNNYKKNQIMNASQPGIQCYQSNPTYASLLPPQLSFLDYSQPTVESEDCLLLDVLVPTKPKSNRLPVIIQIHGGAWVTGNARSFPGNQLVSASNGNVIYVEIQYRLGVQGYLGNSVIRGDGVANAGILDQRSAIEWVQRNIHKFGGDPSKVTIYGGSAGGGSVMDQLILYGGVANPPFRAAIAEYPGLLSHKNESILDEQYNDLLAYTGCTTLACLRGVSSETLANATTYAYAQGWEKGLYAYSDYYFTPTVDGIAIRDYPSIEFQRGHFSKVPVLTDRDAYEGVLFTNFSITTSAEVESNLRAFFPAAKESFFTRLFQLYPNSDFTGSYFDDPFFNSSSILTVDSLLPSFVHDSEFYRFAAIWGDYCIICPSTLLATGVSDYGPPVWKMQFAAGSELHGADWEFLFSAANTTSNATLAAIMKDYILSFATHLDPNAVSYSKTAKPYWPTYLSAVAGTQEKQFTVLRINQTDMGVQVDQDVSEKCEFFAGETYNILH